MPAVSIYISQNILDAVRARANAQKIPVSRIIRKVITYYLSLDETKEAKERVLKQLAKEKPFGGIEAWEGDCNSVSIPSLSGQLF